MNELKTVALIGVLVTAVWAPGERQLQQDRAAGNTAAVHQDRTNLWTARGAIRHDQHEINRDRRDLHADRRDFRADDRDRREVNHDHARLHKDPNAAK